MTTPPSDESGTTDPTAPQPEPPADQVSLDKPAPPPESFDPYRFGAPEHPVPPEYAPPGYRPPPTTAPPAPAAGPPGFGAYSQPYPGQPGQPGQQGQPGQPPPYGYPQPPQYSQYPLPKTGNGKATAALVLGIVSVVFFWTSFFDAIPIVLGLVFGFLGLSESKRTGSGRGTSIAGIVCAFVGAVLAIVLTVVIITRLQTCFNSYSSGSSEFNSCVRHHI